MFTPRSANTNSTATQRFAIVSEIIANEKEYIVDLKEVINTFLVPLRASPISRNRLPKIFSNIELLCSLSNSLSERLIAKFENYKQTDSIPNLGSAWELLGDSMQAYESYCRNHQAALEMLQASFRVPAFLALVESQATTTVMAPLTRGNLFQYLRACLMRPILQVSKYQQLLKELLKYTPSGHPDISALESVLEKIEKVSVKIKEKTEEHVNFLKLLEIQRRLDGFEQKLATPSRVFLCEGPLTKLNPKRKLQLRYFFLFNDLLVWAKSKANKKGGFDCKGYVSLDHAVLDIPSHSSAWLSDNIDLLSDSDKQYKHEFRLVRKDNKKVYILFAPSEKDKNMWVSYLEKFTSGDHLGDEEKDLSFNGATTVRVAKKELKHKEKMKRSSQLPSNESTSAVSQLNQELQHVKLLLDNEQRAREQLQGLCISLAERVTELENTLRLGTESSSTRSH